MLKRRGRKLSLVGQLDSKRFGDRVRSLFSLSIVTSDSEDHFKLFKPKHPVGVRDRQNYTQWKSFVQTSYLHSRKITSWRKVKEISFLRIGEFPQFIHDWRLGTLSLFEVLTQFMEVYFLGFSIDTANSEIHAETMNCITRRHAVTGTFQILAPDLLETIKQRAKFTVAVSWSDLYPSPDLNFVLGQAAFERSSAVISFGRYDEVAKNNEDIASIDGLVLWRLCKALAHETCHMFGLSHCVFFECVMNDSTSLIQAEEQPIHLCPVCLRKLQKVCGFDVELRYVKLRQFFSEVSLVFLSDHFSQTLNWLENCIGFLNDRK